LKALFYTIVLSAILVGVVIYLQSIPRKDRTVEPEATPEISSEDLFDADPGSMTVHSPPAPLSNIDPLDLETIAIDALYDTGTELLDLWHLPEATEVFETLTSQDSQSLSALLRLVECYSHPIVAAERRAEESWRRAWSLAQTTQRDTLLVSAMRSLFIDYSPSSAIGTLTDIVDRGGDNVEARLLLARALLMAGDPSESERYLQELLEGDQSLGRARELLIQCKIAKGEPEAAESLARDLVALYPEEPYPHVLLSRVHLIQGNTKEATERCDNALLLDRRYAPAIVSRAHAYIASGDAEAAKVTFEKLLMFDSPMLAATATEGIAYVDFLYGRFDAAVASMDEAIRMAMSVESTRRGMLYAFRFVDYLCELGRADAAEVVLDRWVSRYSEIPPELGELRILISQGSLSEVRTMLGQLEQDERWLSWMRALSLDYVDFEALALIQEKKFQKALNVLGTASHDPGGTRRVYLTGYAMFQTGDAEGAMAFFKQTRSRLYGVVFPYHSDPVLFVQSMFFLAEAALARGESELAQVHYGEFLRYWGESDWDLQAVQRARAKLETLSMKTTEE